MGMAAQPLFIADECVSRRIVERLRAEGFDVKWIGDDRRGISDTEVLKAAAAEGRILITEDRDFGELVIRQRLAVRGLILTELDRLAPTAEAERISAVVTAHADRLVGNLIVIEPMRVRIRPLSGTTTT
jgi:predicted nuclease of predicted toxin-antitoxin system